MPAFFSIQLPKLFAILKIRTSPENCDLTIRQFPSCQSPFVLRIKDIVTCVHVLIHELEPSYKNYNIGLSLSCVANSTITCSLRRITNILNLLIFHTLINLSFDIVGIAIILITSNLPCNGVIIVEVIQKVVEVCLWK